MRGGQEFAPTIRLIPATIIVSPAALNSRPRRIRLTANLERAT
jgi:hypothetical protein